MTTFDFGRFARTLDKMAATRREKDLALWETWNRSRRPADLQAVVNVLRPVIQKEVQRWSGTLAGATLETKATTLAVEAIKSYNPNMGTALSTHVTNRLQKLSRMVYSHTQAARLPEHKAVAMTAFASAHNQLNSELGRSPTHLELAENLGWSKKRTEDFQSAFQRQELLTSGDFQPSTFAVNDYDQDPIVDFIYHDLSPADQALFEDVTGYGGAKVLSNPKLMKKHKLTQGQLSYRKRKLIDKVKAATAGR